MTLKYYIFYKPFNYLSQFSDEGNNLGLKKILPTLNSDVYSIGRLDLDSEGLIILSNDTKLNKLLIDPIYKHKRIYYVQLEGVIESSALANLQKGVEISLKSKKYLTLPAKACLIEEPSWLGPRIPPIRYRKNKPTSWISLELIEGKNRQVRKMTASVGFPTLRLVRFSIEDINIKNLKSGQIVEISQKEIGNLLKINLSKY